MLHPSLIRAVSSTAQAPQGSRSSAARAGTWEPPVPAIEVIRDLDVIAARALRYPLVELANLVRQRIAGEEEAAESPLDTHAERE